MDEAPVLLQFACLINYFIQRQLLHTSPVTCSRSITTLWQDVEFACYCAGADPVASPSGGATGTSAPASVNSTSPGGDALAAEESSAQGAAAPPPGVEGPDSAAAASAAAAATSDTSTQCILLPLKLVWMLGAVLALAVLRGT